MAGTLPSCLDYADGLSGRAGTPTPSSSIIVQANGGGITPESIPLEEDPDSPELERGEQATITHRFTTSWADAQTRILTLGRGGLFTDSAGNVTKIMSAKIQRQPGRRATLIVVCEGLSFDTPPDRFEIVPVELGLNILKHPRYFYALQGANSTENALNQSVIRLLQDYFENPTPNYRAALDANLFYSMGAFLTGNTSSSINADGSIKSLGSSTPQAGKPVVWPITGTALAKAAAVEIIQKYWHGEEQPYVVGYQMTWTVYYFRPQYLNPGGYVEDPILNASPQVPAYFVSPSYPPTYPPTIFDLMAQINPQCYSSDGTSSGAVNISWLRKADQSEEERTWFKHIRTWIGSAVGFWDPDMYAATKRPQVPSDYAVIRATPPLPDQTSLPTHPPS